MVACGIPVLMEHLHSLLAEVHGDPDRIKRDEELGNLLVGLYETDDLESVWTSIVEPYLRDHSDGLRNVWREHAADPSLRLLDHPEVLLIFERADRDREQLRRVWPGPTSSLTRVSEIWGVPL